MSKRSDKAALVAQTRFDIRKCLRFVVLNCMGYRRSLQESWRKITPNGHQPIGEGPDDRISEGHRQGQGSPDSLYKCVAER